MSFTFYCIPTATKIGVENVDIEMLRDISQIIFQSQLTLSFTGKEAFHIFRKETASIFKETVESYNERTFESIYNLFVLRKDVADSYVSCIAIFHAFAESFEKLQTMRFGKEIMILE